jgi:hypothetical protein
MYSPIITTIIIENKIDTQAVKRRLLILSLISFNVSLNESAAINSGSDASKTLLKSVTCNFTILFPNRLSIMAIIKIVSV